MLTVLTEMTEANFAAKPHSIPPSVLTSHLHCVGNLTRVLLALGLQRRAKEVPDLQTYLRQRAHELQEQEKEQDAVNRNVEADQ